MPLSAAAWRRELEGGEITVDVNFYELNFLHATREPCEDTWPGQPGYLDPRPRKTPNISLLKLLFLSNFISVEIALLKQVLCTEIIRRSVLGKSAIGLGRVLPL